MLFASWCVCVYVCDTLCDDFEYFQFWHILPMWLGKQYQSWTPSSSSLSMRSSEFPKIENNWNIHQIETTEFFHLLSLSPFSHFSLAFDDYIFFRFVFVVHFRFYAENEETKNKIRHSTEGTKLTNKFYIQ